MSFIPGLSQDEPEEDVSQTTVGQSRTIEVKKEQEWRFEVALGKTIEVKVQNTSLS